MNTEIFHLNPNRLIDLIRDLIENRIETDSGFLRALIGIRFVFVLLGLTIYFYLVPLTKEMQPLARMAIGAYFAYILILGFLAEFHESWFVGAKSKQTQLVWDSCFSLVFYWLSGTYSILAQLTLVVPFLLLIKLFHFRTALLYGAIMLVLILWMIYLKYGHVGVSEGIGLVILTIETVFFFAALSVVFLLTRRRRVIANLAHSENLLLEELGEIGDGVFSIDRDFFIQEANQKFMEWHGIVSGVLYSKEICSNGKESRACRDCPLLTSINSLRPVETGHVRYADRHGIIYEAIVSAYPHLDRNGSVLGATAIVRNISERERTIKKWQSLSRDIEETIEQQNIVQRRQLQALTQLLSTLSQVSSDVALVSNTPRDAIGRIMEAGTSRLGCEVTIVRVAGINDDNGRWGLLRKHHIWNLPSTDSTGVFVDLNTSSDAYVIKAYRTGQIIQISDLSKHHQNLVNLDVRQAGLMTGAYFPLATQDEVIGTFSLYRKSQEPFTDEQIVLAKTLANYLALVLSTERNLAVLAQDKHAREEWQELESSTDADLNGASRVHQIAKRFAAFVSKKLSSEVSNVFLTRDNILQRVANFGLEEDWFAEEVYEIGEGITGQAIVVPEGARYGQPQLENEVDTNPRTIPGHLSAYSQKLRSGTVRHMIVVPLNGSKCTLGAVRVINHISGDGTLSVDGFRKSDLDLLKGIAPVVASEIEHVLDLEAEQHRREMAEALYACANALASARGLEEILQNILEQIRRVLYYDTASLFLLEEEKLVMSVYRGFSPEEEPRLKALELNAATNIPFVLMREKHEPVFIVDEAEAHMLDAVVGTERTRSWLGAPLIVRGRIIGQLAIDAHKPNIYGKEQGEILLAFAQNAAILIDNAKLAEQNERAAMIRERDRLRDDLHDVMNTFQFQVMLQVENLRDEFLHLNDLPRTAQLDELFGRTRYMYRELKRILDDMGNQLLVEQGLPVALDVLCKETKTPKIDIQFRLVDPPSAQERLPPGVEHALFRISQEAINNCLKHADLHNRPNGKISVILKFKPTGISLWIIDNGCGFNYRLERRGPGMGLPGMSRWAKSVGAEFQCESRVDRFTRIHVFVPNEVLNVKDSSFGG